MKIHLCTRQYNKMTQDEFRLGMNTAVYLDYILLTASQINSQYIRRHPNPSRSQEMSSQCARSRCWSHHSSMPSPPSRRRVTSRSSSAATGAARCAKSRNGSIAHPARSPRAGPRSGSRWLNCTMRGWELPRRPLPTTKRMFGRPSLVRQGAGGAVVGRSALGALGAIA
jgi:hypothetical protein